MLKIITKTVQAHEIQPGHCFQYRGKHYQVSNNPVHGFLRFIVLKIKKHVHLKKQKTSNQLQSRWRYLMIKIKTCKSIILGKLKDGYCFMYNKSYYQKMCTDSFSKIKCYCFNSYEVAILGPNYEIRPVTLEIRETLCPE